MAVELRVRDGGEDILVYAFKNPSDAGEMIRFLSEFFPDGEFIIQPLRH